MPFEILYFSLPNFLRSIDHLSTEQQRAILRLMKLKLEERVIDAPATPEIKALGKGLFELRVRRNPDLLFRVFWTYGFTGQIFILSGYDKKRDSSELTQQRHISQARTLLDSVRKNGYSK